MSQFARLDSVRALLEGLLRREVVRGVLVPVRQPHGPVMPSLVVDPVGLEAADPEAPVAWVNAGSLVSSLTAGERGGGVAAVLRSCETRAFIERAKLHQGRREGVLILGIDCLGRYENRDYLTLSARFPDLSTRLAAGEDPLAPLAEACAVCTSPVAEAVDLQLCTLGTPGEGLVVEARTDAGHRALAALGAIPCEAPAGRDGALRDLLARRTAERTARFAAFTERTATLEGLARVLAACTRCTNCRVACPVCYCRECVFVTDAFHPEGDRLVARARTRGTLRMPADVSFYHLTRMAHMSTLCVGCGQCTSACPQDIPVSLLFQTVSDRVQARFAFVPGRDPDEPQPLATYREGEFEDVAGGGGR